VYTRNAVLILQNSSVHFQFVPGTSLALASCMPLITWNKSQQKEEKRKKSGIKKVGVRTETLFRDSNLSSIPPRELC